MTRTIFTFKNIRCGAYDNYLEQNIFEGEGGGEGGRRLFESWTRQRIVLTTILLFSVFNSQNSWQVLTN